MPTNERLNLSVSFGGAVKATATTTIIDTSLPAYEYILVGSNPSSTEIYQSDAPTYLLSSNVSTVNEGDAITFTLNTTMLDTGTIIPYTITGVSVSDISLSTLTGNFVTDATGKATLSFSIINDIATEGNETLILTLNALNVSKSVIINDTSMMPTYVAGWYGNSTGTTAVLSSVDEGQHAYLVVKTTNVPNGTVLNVTLSGDVSVADLAESSLSTTMTVTNNIAHRLYNTRIDQTTEGNEALVATCSVNGTVIGTTSIKIIDTSLPVISGDIGFVTTMTVKLDTTPGFDSSYEPSDSGNRTNRYSEGDFYVSRGSNGSFQLQGVKGTIANANIVLDNWSFRLFSWFTWREDTWGGEGYVVTAQSYPSINLVAVSGTPPSTFYAKFGDTSYTFTRQADVNGRLVYSDITKGNDNGFKYDGISTRLNFALTPV